MMTPPHPWAQGPAEPRSRTVGVWTRIDAAGWAADACRRIYERELQSRMPNVRIRFVDDAADAAVLGNERGDVVISPAHFNGASVVRDPLTLLGRLITPRIARRRIDYLRAMDRYPQTETVLLEVAADRLDHLPELGRRVQDAIEVGYRITVVAVPVPGEAMTAELQYSVERSIAPAYCFEPECLEDLIAVIASSVVVVPLSPALLAAACAFGRPSLRLPEATWCSGPSSATACGGVERMIHGDFRSALRAAQDHEAVREWSAQLDAHFNRIAADLAAGGDRAAGPEPARSSAAVNLEAARQSVWRRLADERLRFAERAETWLTEISRLKGEIARLTAREAALRQEMADVSAHARHELLRAGLAYQPKRQSDPERARLEGTGAALPGTEEALVERIAVLSNENADLRREVERLHGAVMRFARSKSWRYLAPARAVGQLLRRLARVRQ